MLNEPKQLNVSRLLVATILLILIPQISVRGQDIFEYNGSEELKLTGNWLFKYAESVEALQSVQYEPHQIPNISWVHYPNKGYTKDGIGIYKTTIINQSSDEIGILFPFVVLEYEIRANGELLYETKNFTKPNHKKGLPARIRGFFKLPKSDTINLEVTIKNNITREPGINLSPIVNSYERLQASEEKRQIFEYTGIGILFIIGVYHLVLYGFLKSRSALWLALTALAIALRATVVYDGFFLLYNLIPDLTFSFAKRIEYFAIYLTPLFSTLFFRDQFLIRKYDVILRYFAAISIVMAIAVIIFPVHIFESTITVLHVLGVIGIFLTVDILRIAIINKVITSQLILAGYIIPFFLAILEIMKTENWIYIDLGPNMLNTAMVIYIFVQAVAVGVQIALVYKENQFLNQNLEKSVEEKTIKLSEANSTKSHILSVVSHDLMNPLNNLKGALELLNSNILKIEDLKKMKESFTSQINHNIGLMEDVLSWSSIELKKEQSSDSIKQSNIEPVVETVFKQLKQPALDKRIKLINEIQEETIALIDPDALVIILRNLVSNAIKFSHQRGVVEVNSEVNNGHVKIGVIDNGIGIPNDLREKIFVPEHSVTRIGTDEEKGKGVGLLIVKDLVTQNDGKIWIEENPKKEGAAFYFQLNHSKNPSN